MVNKVLKNGKKSTSEGWSTGRSERIRDRTGRDPVAVMEEAVRNVTPALEVKSRRVGGATYQVPIEVPPRRGRTLAIRWIVRFARERREQMSERLANELLDAGLSGGRLQAEGRPLPDGSGEQGVRALPLVEARPLARAGGGGGRTGDPQARGPAGARRHEEGDVQ